MLADLRWTSLIELGCGSGPNLIQIVKHLPGKQLAGLDVNADAIEEAAKVLKGAGLRVGDMLDTPFSDKGADIVLTDMACIYVSPRDIQKQVTELRRLARNYVVLCEFNSTSWWSRFKLRRSSGYYAHDWKKELEKQGFYDILVQKLPPNSWPDPETGEFHEPQKTYGYIIIAKVSNY